MFVRKRRYRRQLKRPKREIRIVDGRYITSFRATTERTYYQVCESYRDERGRPRQRVICALEDKPLAEQIAGAHAALERYGSEKLPRTLQRLECLERLREQIGDWAP